MTTQRDQGSSDDHHSVDERSRLDRDLRAAEEARRESEARYRALIEASEDAVFVADAETGRLLDVNPQAERLTGRPASELIGMHQSELHPQPNEGHYRRVFERHSNERGERVDEAIVLRADGATVPVEISASVATINGRKTVLGIFRDVTVRRRTEQALAESEERYRKVVEAAADGIAVADVASGLLVEINPRLADRLGYDPAELVGQHHEVLYAPEDAALNVATFKRHARGGVREIEAYWLQTRDGERVPFEATSSTTKVGGRLLIQGIFRDATDRRKTEEALREREALFRALFEGANLGIAVMGPDAKVRRSNPALSHILGYDVRDSGVGIAEHELDHIYEPFFTTKEFGQGTGSGSRSCMASWSSTRGRSGPPASRASGPSSGSSCPGRRVRQARPPPRHRLRPLPSPDGPPC